jgi:hypothetical protein
MSCLERYETELTVIPPSFALTDITCVRTKSFAWLNFSSLGDDCSDVFQRLATSFPLSDEAQIALQKQILHSG